MNKKLILRYLIISTFLLAAILLIFHFSPIKNPPAKQDKINTENTSVTNNPETKYYEDEENYDNPPSKNILTFKSKHGFSIQYPANYFLVDHHKIENLDTLPNEYAYFEIDNYDMSKVHGSEFFPKNMFRLYISICKTKFSSYEEWIKDYPGTRNVTSIEDIKLNSGTAKVIKYKYYNEMDNQEEESTYIYFLNDKIQVRFDWNPEDHSIYLTEIYNIIKSFNIY